MEDLPPGRVQLGVPVGTGEFLTPSAKEGGEAPLEKPHPTGGTSAQAARPC